MDSPCFIAALRRETQSPRVCGLPVLFSLSHLEWGCQDRGAEMAEMVVSGTGLRYLLDDCRVVGRCSIL